MAPVMIRRSDTAAARAASAQPAAPVVGQVAGHHQVQVPPLGRQEPHGRDQPFRALPDVAPAHRERIGPAHERPQVVIPELPVGAVGRAEERRDPRPDRHHPIGRASEQVDGLPAGVLGIGEDEVGGPYPVAPASGTGLRGPPREGSGGGRGGG